MFSGGYFIAEGFCVINDNMNVIIPTLPTNIVNAKINLPNVFHSEVIPIPMPTVPKPDTVSKTITSRS